MSTPKKARPVSPRASCLLAWGSLLGLIAVLALGVALPWFEHNEILDEQIASTRDQSERVSAILATLPGLKKELEKAQKNDDYKAFYFDAETPALAGAELQRKVQDVVTDAKARLVSTQILPVSTDEKPPRVRLRTQLQGDTDALLNVLYALERARPFLFVDQLSVRASTPRRASARSRASRSRNVRRRAPTSTREPGQLTVRLDVFGFALGDSK